MNFTIDIKVNEKRPTIPNQRFFPPPLPPSLSPFIIHYVLLLYENKKNMATRYGRHVYLFYYFSFTDYDFVGKISRSKQRKQKESNEMRDVKKIR